MTEEYFRMRCGVYLFLERGNETLLSLRQNTGYADGFHGLLGGHLEDGETFVEATIREALEEGGIEIDPQDLHLAHIMHRLDNIQTVNVFFTCSVWRNEVRNCEPHKCVDLSFFDKAQLPETLTPFIRLALQYIEEGKPFSELGFRFQAP